MFGHLKLCLLLLIFDLENIKSNTLAGVYVDDDGYKEALIGVVGNSSNVKCNTNCSDPVYLTKYIKLKKIDDGKRAAQVDCKLLGGVKSYAGYITVNETYNTNLWFWYVPATDKPTKEAPLLVYPSSVPGAYVTYDFLTVISPMTITASGKLENNNATWTKRHSVLVIDCPAGTGFSYTENDLGYAVNVSQVGRQLYSFMKQIRLVFEEMQTAPIFLVGNIYGAIQTSALGITILENRRDKSAFDIQGFLFFDGFFEPEVKFNISRHNLVLGLLDKQTADIYAKLLTQANNLIDPVTKEYQSYSSYATAVMLYSKALRLLAKNRKIPNTWSIALDSNIKSEVYLKYLQSPDVRCKLHVGNRPLQILCKAYNKMQNDIYSGGRTRLLTNLRKSYPILFSAGTLYSGASYIYEQNYYDTFINFKPNAIRQHFFYNGTTVGYYKEVENATSIVFRNMGNILGGEKRFLIERLIYVFTLLGKLESS